MKHVWLIVDLLPESRIPEYRRVRVIANAAIRQGWRVTVLTAKGVELDSRTRGDAWTKFFAGSTRARLRTVWGGISAATLARCKAWLAKLRGGNKITRLLSGLDRVGYGLWFLCMCIEGFIVKARPNAIVMASFPYSSHVPGISLSRLWKVPLIIDTGDGWVLDDEDSVALLNLSEKELQRQGEILLSGLTQASQIWCASKPMTEGTANTFPNIPRDKFVDVIQGYEQNDAVRDTQTVTVSDRLDNALMIGYAGRFRPKKTPIEPLLAAFTKLKEDEPNLYRRIRVRVWDAGDHDDLFGRYLRLSIDRNGHASQFEILDGVPENEAIKVLTACDALYLSQSDDEWMKKRLPAKLFTYLSVPRPMLATCNPESEMASFIAESGVGFRHATKDAAGLAATILKLLTARESKSDIGIARNAKFLKPYSLDAGVIPSIGNFSTPSESSSKGKLSDVLYCARIRIDRIAYG